MPPCLILQAADDPWVPAAAAQRLAASPPAGLQVLLPRHGGHNGFHGVADQRSWADQIAVRWLQG